MILRRLLLSVALLGSAAHAEPVPGGDVRVERSESALDCPDEHDVVRSALALGTAPAGASGSSLVVRFDRDGAAYRALVSSTGQKTGERELRADDPDCRRLADAVAVVVAVLLDIVPPEAAASFEVAPPSPPAPTAAPEPSAANERPERAPAVAPLPARRPSRFELSLRAEGALTVGLLGVAVSPAAGGAVALKRGPWQAALGGFWVAPREIPFEPLPGTGVFVTLALGSVDGCFRFAARPGTWETWLCARFLAGVLGGDGRGFDHHFPTHEAWFGAGPAFSLRLPLTRAVALRAGASVAVTLGDHTFRVENYGTAFDSPPLSAGIALGPELTIW